MNAKQRRHFERAQRVDLFMDAHAEDFPAGGKGGDAAARLKELLAGLTELDVARAAAASRWQQGSAGRRAAREGLRALLQAVLDTAHAITLDHPDLSGIFTFPNADRSDRTLVALARSTAGALAPLVNLFVGYNMPATIINDLRSKADSLEHYMALQTEGLGARANSNVSAAETLQLVNGQVERLDAAVRNKYRDDHPTLVAWDRARRIESAPQHKDGGPDTPPPTTED